MHTYVGMYVCIIYQYNIYNTYKYYGVKFSVPESDKIHVHMRPVKKWLRPRHLECVCETTQFDRVPVHQFDELSFLFSNCNKMVELQDDLLTNVIGQTIQKMNAIITLIYAYKCNH